jgi:MEDS: MEthanogen/methylotroph, DcmR Sensory domain
VIQDMVRNGAHSCAVLTSDEQWWEVLADFVAGGMEREERVLLVGLTDAEGAEVRSRLSEDGADPDAATTRGDLIVLPEDLSREFFQSPEIEVAAKITDELDDAIRGGYRGIRLSGVYTGVGIGPQEPTVDRLMRGKPLTVLCPYRRQNLTYDEVDRIRELHDSEVVDDALYDDSMLRVTRPRPGWLRLAGRMTATNYAAVLDVVAAAARGGDRDLDLASLRDIDAAAAHALITSVGRGVRLRHPGPLVQRIARLLARGPVPTAVQGPTGY